MRRRLALALLLLLAVPASSATYWVSPTGHYGRTSQYDGSDSTDFRALSLSWANDSASAGDVIRLKSSYDVASDPGSGGIPQYTIPIRPRNSGLSNSERIWYIGDIADPGSRKVPYIQIDSTTTTYGGAKRFISVYGVRAVRPTGSFSNDTLGALKVRSLYGSSGYDSVAYCTIDGNTEVSLRSNVTITHCSIGNGLLRGARYPTLHLEGHGTGTVAINYIFSDSLLFTYNDVNCAMGQAQLNFGNVLTLRMLSSPEIAHNAFRLRLYRLQDTSLFTDYYCQSAYIHDNVFSGWADTSDGKVMYLLNVRDGQIANRWIDNTFIEDEDSVVPLKAMMATSGNNYPTFDPGSHNNLWQGNFIRVRSFMGYDDPDTKGDIHRFNTYLTGEYFRWGNTNTATADSLIFQHNTLVSFADNGHLNMSEHHIDTTAATRISRNIFASLLKVPGTAPGHGYIHAVLGARGTASSDSNYYWCWKKADSTLMVANAIGIGPSTWQQYCAAVPQECGSYWGNKAAGTTNLFADTSWATFDGYPTTASRAIDATLWGTDGYVGARGPASDATAPVVAITAPLDGQVFGIGDIANIAWTASDNVAVTRIDIDRGKAGPTTTWYTVKHSILTDVNDGEWFWTVANTKYTRTYIRVTAYDAAGNSSSSTVYITHPCTPCNSDDPFFEVP